MNKLNRCYISQNISIDNALSMNQILHQIVNEIKGIVDFINNLELRANEYTDEQIRLLNERLQAQLETLEDTLKTYTNDKIDEYNAEIINPQLTEIRNTIDTINRTINERIDREVGIINRHINSVESTLNKKIDDTKEYLEELIRKGNQLVYSSISGRKIPIQDTLFEMGNALKQILSYNWNTINLLKTVGGTTYDFIRNISNFNITYSSNNFTKGILVDDVPTEDNKKYVYIKYNCPSYFDDKQIGYTSMIPYCKGTSEDLITATSAPINVEKVDNNIVRYNVNVNMSGGYTHIFLPLKYNDSTFFNENDYDNINVYYGEQITPVNNITWNTLKSQMQNTDIEIRPNWNGLVFDGVNGWNILASVGGLYDDETVINPLWNELPYKNNVYRNEKSSFYNQIEN